MPQFAKRFLTLIIFIFAATSCQQPADPTPAAVSSPLEQLAATAETVIEQQFPTATPTPTATATSTFTPTPTNTPTPTPTSTPTALPITIDGDPRAAILTSAETTGGRCGLVDLLDFPLGPPDAAGFSGGRDFGRFRDRFGKYHAGEDWWTSNRGGSFGKPVYSIGNGWVTYAQPEGWGRDKGVIIIEHIFTDGSTVLSFYGHLDPPSFEVEAGDCVTRGQLLANIGRPRSAPHLHFEIRTQAPWQTLTGYWEVDPTTQGWLPPSHYIWNQRIAASPYVSWTRPPVAVGVTLSVGLVDAETFAVVEEGELRALSLTSGQIRWRYALNTADEDVGVISAALDAQAPIVYVVANNGEMMALDLIPAVEGGLPTLTPLWAEPVQLISTPNLLPLAGGGVGISTRRDFTAVSADGELLWTNSEIGLPVDSLLLGDSLLIATSGSGSLWSITQQGATLWDVPSNGKLVQTTAGALWLHSPEALYRLDVETQMAVPHYLLPRGAPSRSDLLALPDGGLLLAHGDSFDRRLIRFDAAGTLVWERSYEPLEGSPELQLLDGAVYLVLEDTNSATIDLHVYGVDLETAALTHLFTGGTRSPLPNTWVGTAGSQLVVNIGGGHLFVFRPEVME